MFVRVTIDDSYSANMNDQFMHKRWNFAGSAIQIGKYDVLWFNVNRLQKDSSMHFERVLLAGRNPDPSIGRHNPASKFGFDGDHAFDGVHQLRPSV